MIDLDHNAGARLDPRVRTAMAALLERDDLGNPSSLHRAGQAARAVVEHARRTIAAAVGADPLEVTLTSGGTEADALAILGIGRARRAAGQPAAVVTSPIEHPAVLGAVAQLAAEGHAVHTVVPDAQGRIGTEALGATLAQAQDVGLVSLAAANHELGNAYAIAELSEVVRQTAPGAVVHTDAVQAFGRIPLNRTAWGVDAIAISAHKVGGPRGVGALIHERTLTMAPLVGAGHHERGRRPGTESVLSIHGFAVAAELAASDLAANDRNARACRAALAEGVVACGGRIYGDPQQHVGNTITAAFDGVDGHLLMIALDLEGIAVSTGAACDAGSASPSAVLTALGHASDAKCSIRMSVSPTCRAADVAQVLQRLPALLHRLRGAKAS